MNQKTFALLGHPVGHSVSPQIHQAVYEQFGLTHRYVAIDCPDESAMQRQKSALAHGEIDGANITVPWKRVALQLADRVDGSAEKTGAANVWCRAEDGAVVAYNTDAAALAERVLVGLEATGSVEESFTSLVLGNGGAALAAVVACQEAGAERVFVTARKWLSGREDTWPSRAEFDALGAIPVSWSGGEPRDPSLPRAARESRVVIQATSAGMLGVGHGDEVVRALSFSELRRDVFLYDVVYNPERTPFLDAAKSEGLVHEGGLSMLIGQAALAVRLWLALDPDRANMHRAASRAIFGVHE